MKRRRYRLSKTARRVLALSRECEGVIIEAAVYCHASWWRTLDGIGVTMRALERNGLIEPFFLLDSWYRITPAGRRALARGWR